MSSNFSKILLYKEVKADPTYKMLFNNSALPITGKPVATLTGTQAKPTEAIRLDITNVLYDDIYNCNYMIIEDGKSAQKYLYCFVNDIHYVNDSLALVSYKIDYYNSYAVKLEGARGLVQSTSLIIPSISGKYDTPALDHTAPETILSQQTIKPTTYTTEVYYYDLPENVTITPPHVSFSSSYSGSTNEETATGYIIVTGQATETDLTTGASQKIPWSQGLSHAALQDKTDLITDPRFYNSDGSSRILYSEIHEDYPELSFDTTKMIDALSFPIYNRQNPFMLYSLTIGDQTSNIPSRYLSDDGSLYVYHSFPTTPGSQDIFNIKGTGSNLYDKHSITLSTLHRPLVLSGTYAKYYKQRNRLTAEAKTLANSINNDISNFLIGKNVGLSILRTSRDTSKKVNGLNNTLAKAKADNGNDLAVKTIASNFTNDQGALTYSQGIAKQSLTNALSTTLDNLSMENKTAMTTTKASQSLAGSILDKTNTLKMTNLKTSQDAQLTNLENSYHTNTDAIDISALSNFFEKGAGAVFSGSLKAALMATLNVALTGAVDTLTAQAQNNLKFEGAGATNAPEGAKAQLQESQKAQTTTMQLSNDLASENLKQKNAVALANLTTDQNAKSYTTQNSVNTQYANKMLEFKNQANNLQVGNTKAKFNQGLSYGNIIKNIGLDLANSNAIVDADYTKTFTTSVLQALADTKQLVNNINNRIYAYNTKMNSLIADTADDVIVIGQEDDSGKLDQGLRDVTLSIYWQGPDIYQENINLASVSGLTVNVFRTLGADFFSGKALGVDPSDPDTQRVYIKATAVSGLYQVPGPGRQMLIDSLEKGCFVYT